MIKTLFAALFNSVLASAKPKRTYNSTYRCSNIINVMQTLTVLIMGVKFII